MSARDKAGLGYGDQLNKGVLSYENEVFQSVFVSRTSETENSLVNDRYAEGMHAVPPPMIGIYIPSGPDKEIDDSQFSYGPKQSKPSESDARSSDFNSCESNCSEETHESMPEPVVNEPKVVSEPKVWSDAPIIEEYESDSEDEHVSLPTKEQEIPSFADKHVKTPRQTVIEQNTCSQSSKTDKKDCSGLMSKNGFGIEYTKKHAVPINVARKVNTVKPIVNNTRSKAGFHKSVSPFGKSFNRTTALRTNFSKQKVNTAEVNAVSAVKGQRETVVKPSAGCNWRPKRHYWHKVSKYNGGSSPRNCATFKDPIRQISSLNWLGLWTGKQGLSWELQDFNGVALLLWRTVKVYITRFSWVFFLRTKDETSGILKDFIRQIENQLNQKVKTIRCDNGTEFKNRDIIEFCGSKGIKREYSNARTPQQNGVAERKNRTLIEAARTMLADSFLPNTFWAEAVSTACYVLNRVLVTKPQNKTPYELITGPEEANHSAGIQDNIDARNSKIEADPAQDYFVLSICSSYTSTVKSSEAKNEELERLKRQEKEGNDAAEALRKEFAQDAEDLLLQAGAAKATSTNTVITVRTPISTASPSNVFSAGGPALNNNGQDDSQIPALEDIYDSPNDRIFTNASYDDEGAVADFTNLESTMNVSPIPTLRIHSIHHTTHILRDPKLAVQTRSKVNKSSRAYAFISQALEMKLGSDAMLEELLAIHIQKSLDSGFGLAFWEEGNLDKMAGLEANRIFLALVSYRGFIVSQIRCGRVPSCMGKIDEKSWCDECVAIDEERIPVELYRSSSPGSLVLQVKLERRLFLFISQDKIPLIGSLVYLTALLAEIMFAVSRACSSDYAGANLDRKSTTGGCQFLGRRLVSWQCKKQTIMATSTTEAEYVAAANCCGQVLWIQNQIVSTPDLLIEIRHHFIRDAYEKKLIHLLKIHTDDNVADL
ncbi:putative ribonuclease H-like domain-containing protein [Tanacetum coccineum]|uniref:Ribonuclease H-like domain-containing protein n=1 Tax=Tanacetum coccineum TaxID=301880 RepID=A0ABQ4XQS4_9ASTR